VSKWKEFLDGIATDGGNIFILFFIIIAIGVFIRLGITDLHDQLIFALGALIGILKGNLTKNT
jgi:hypothetical protein